MSTVTTLATQFGFAETQTGGGCTALERTLPDGSYLLITDDGGCETPRTVKTEVLVGLYEDDGEEAGYWYFKTLPDALSHVTAHFAL